MKKEKRGFLRHRQGERDRYATPRKSDVVRFLDLAMSETDPKRKEAYSKYAEIARRFERMNEKMGVHNRGRPVGATGEHRYAGMIQAMAKIAEATGEKRHHKLARLAAEAGHAPQSVTEGAAIKQAAILWKRRITK